MRSLKDLYKPFDPVLKVGSYVRVIGYVYVLASLGGHRVCLINITTGGRYTNPISVDDVSNVSKAESQRLLKDDWDKAEVLTRTEALKAA